MRHRRRRSRGRLRHCGSCRRRRRSGRRRRPSGWGVVTKTCRTCSRVGRGLLISTRALISCLNVLVCWRNVDASRYDFFLCAPPDAVRAPTFVIVPASCPCGRVCGWPSRVAQPLVLPRCRPALPVSTVADGRVPSSLGGGERDRRRPSRAQCHGSACGLPGPAAWTSAGCLWLPLTVAKRRGGGGIAPAELLCATVAPRRGSGAESTLVLGWWPLTC